MNTPYEHRKVMVDIVGLVGGQCGGRGAVSNGVKKGKRARPQSELGRGWT